MDDLIWLLVAGYALSPVVLGILLAAEAKKRRQVAEALGRLENQVHALRAARTREVPRTDVAAATVVLPTTAVERVAPTAPPSPAAADAATPSPAAADAPTPSPAAADAATPSPAAADAPTPSPPRSGGEGQGEGRAASPAPPTLPPLPPVSPPPGDGRGANGGGGLQLDWERLVGVRLYSWIAGVAVVVAAISFVRYSIDHGWIGAPVRLAIGVLAGLGLVVGGETRAAQRYRVTAQALAASGIATLFATLYAAHALWHLVPALPTFALLALVAAAAVVLSIRRDALVVALLGLVGGFATPFLLSTGEDRPLGLFSYLLLLNVGLSWVGWKKRWPVLPAVSLALTALYQAGWVLRFLDASKLPIAVSVFLVFPLVGFVGLALARRGGAEPGKLARLTAALGAVPPATLALWLATSGSFGARWPLVLGFLALVAVGLAAVAAWQGPEWLHLLGGAAVLATVAAFVARSLGPEAWPGLAAFLVLYAAIYAGAPHLLARLRRDFGRDGRHGVWVAPLLLAALVVVPARLGTAPLGTGAFVLAVLVLLGLTAAHAVARGVAPLHAVAGLLATLALASWAVELRAPATVLPLAAAAGALGLALVAIPAIASRLGRPLRLPLDPAPPVEALALGAHAVVGLAFMPTSDGSAAAPWLAVLGLVHLALLWDALRRRRGGVLVASAAAACLVLIVGGAGGAVPAPALALGVGVAVLSVFAAAWRLGAERLALAAALVGAGATLGYALTGPGPKAILGASVAPYLLSVAYPLARGRRSLAERLPFGGAVLASAAFFLAAQDAVRDLGGAPYLGALPVLQALLLVPHLVLLVRAEPRERRDVGRLALVAGAALAFVTVAIPLQLERQWITIGWALEAAALAWLWLRVPHRGLLAVAGGLLAAVFVRLALNPEILRYQPRSETPILNWYLYTYAVAAAASFVASRFLARGDDRLDPRWPRLSALAAATGAALLFVLVNLEIADFWSTGPRIELRFSAGLAPDLTYTIAWALFAIGLLVAGVLLRARAARVAAIALLALTVLKAFLHDLSRLDGLYRVASFVGLAASLALVAVVLQRFVLREPERAPAPEVSP